jgi:ubiquinone/menaquinone biosynthesis C-methylase UbiE
MGTRADYLADLQYFVSWGGEGAVVLARKAFEEFLPGDLSGIKVLELGVGGGHMSTLFGLLGAEVVGIDFWSGYPEKALAEAAKWGVAERMDFRWGSTEALQELPDSTFDLVFTKSVLAYIKDLEPYLQIVATKVKVGGRICFLENLTRNFLDHLARNLIHRIKGVQNFHYMTPRRIAAIGRVFRLQKDIPKVMNSAVESRTPGWYLICGYRACPDYLPSINWSPLLQLEQCAACRKICTLRG